MRYENLNPQYIALIEKIKEQEKEIEKLNRNYQFVCEYNKKIVDRFNSITEQIDVFESLPWYAKIAFKFKT